MTDLDRQAIRPEVIDSVARVQCDDAYNYGDRLHGWHDSGEDVRDTYRGLARAVITMVLDEYGVPHD